MSLAEPNFIDITQKQYQYKLKAYLNFLLTMIAVQAMALLFSSGGVGATHLGVGSVSLSMRTFSGDIIVIFTGFWSLVVAIFITTKEYRDGDFILTANRRSANLANIAYLLTVSILAGVTAILGSVFLRVMQYFLLGPEQIAATNFFITPREFILTVTVASLYFILLAAIGYFIGSLVQFNKAFIIVLPGLFFGSLIVSNGVILVDALAYFLEEPSFVMLVVKIMVVAVVLFTSATLLSDRLEVRV
ncbi:hypothetical protein [Dethiobacter alkaliphilus]|uniref:hypothetical protein n=1 Tax=Dethiobacter alkaliphilus TaxID=427926 RepID=UPI002225BAA1|nr:hypothetical protein [Dethiobacter alkaliphilus]MCW3489049.1 hypothetical protein [Dethiobacter alkaliphilus]